jgi:hypothetical protein
MCKAGGSAASVQRYACRALADAPIKMALQTHQASIPIHWIVEAHVWLGSPAPHPALQTGPWSWAVDHWCPGQLHAADHAAAAAAAGSTRACCLTCCSQSLQPKAVACAVVRLACTEVAPAPATGTREDKRQSQEKPRPMALSHRAASWHFMVG